MISSLWHGGDRYVPVKTQLAPTEEINPTSFLVLGVTRRSGSYTFARFDFGEAVTYGETDNVERIIRESYKESSRIGIPLVIVVPEERDRSPRRDKLKRTVRFEVNAFKSNAMKRQVAVPRLYTASGDIINRKLFGQRRPDVEAQVQHAEKILGVSMRGAEHLARPICIADLLSRTRLGALVTPTSFLKRFEAQYGQ